MDAALRGRLCLVFSADQRVHLEATEDDYYPDLVVTCEPPRFVSPAPGLLVNPTAVLIEAVPIHASALLHGRRVRPSEADPRPAHGAGAASANAGPGDRPPRA